MQREFTGRHMLYTMLGFFAVIITVNLVMATFAGMSWTGLIVKNSYVASQDFNGRIAATEARDAKGWTADLSLSDGVLTFRLADKAGAPIVLAGAEARFGRPTNENEDMTVALAADGLGGYSGAVDPRPGAWNVEVTAANIDKTMDTWVFRISVER